MVFATITGRSCTSRTSTAASGAQPSSAPGWPTLATASTTSVTRAFSRLVAADAYVKLVQAVAGHSNPLVTLKRYAPRDIVFWRIHNRQVGFDVSFDFETEGAALDSSRAFSSLSCPKSVLNPMD